MTPRKVKNNLTGEVAVKDDKDIDYKVEKAMRHI